MKREHTAEFVIAMLEKLYPEAKCALHYDGIPERLVVSTILSAQTTDSAVNRVTPALWKKYPTMSLLALAERSDVEVLLKTIGLFRNKADFIIRAARFMADNTLPDTISGLVEIPGVGRKTANVVTGEIFGKPSITVDTHVKRLSMRLGLSVNTSPRKIEQDLKKLIPPEDQIMFCHRLITHGRNVCRARKPLCGVCSLAAVCPSTKKGNP
ncbi:MAG: endonuclease III [Candidatus Fermentibacteraceae bacterium]|nr:endonuclease III [Candidatus Fermentibacteraceae bacterium]